MSIPCNDRDFFGFLYSQRKRPALPAGSWAIVNDGRAKVIEPKDNARPETRDSAVKKVTLFTLFAPSARNLLGTHPDRR
jgi:hypothetical protein